MAEEITSDGLQKPRTVLGELANRLRKREFSQREKDGIQSVNFNDKDTAKRIRVSAGQCTEVNSLKGNVISSIPKITNENRNPNLPEFGSNLPVSKSSIDAEKDCSDGQRLNPINIVMGNSKGHDENKIIKNVDSQFVNELDVVNSIATESNGCVKLDFSSENMVLGTSEVIPENKLANFKDSVIGNGVENLSKGDTALHGGCFLDGKNPNHDEADASSEGTQSDNNDYRNELEDHNADNFLLSQSGSIDCTILPESQESRVFGVEKSTELKNGDEVCAFMSGGIDSIKSCSCSFCTKAAYIWLDLNYQDIKARVSAMKKSHKEAIILAERSCRSKAFPKHGAESSARLETDLKYQWRSLFQNMADIWEEEGNQLEGRLLPLTDLKEKCKTDLELINARPFDKH